MSFFIEWVCALRLLSLFYDDIKYVEKKNTKYCRNDPENFETLVCIQNIEDTRKRKKVKKKTKQSVPSLMKLI